MYLDIVKVLLPAIITFVIGIGITPLISNYLYQNQMWKKKVKATASDGRTNEVFQKLHAEKEINTPRLGGSIIWISVVITTILFWSLSFFPFTGEVFSKLEFLSRNQTWILLSALIIGALIGALDDLLEIKGEGGYIAGGLSLKKRLLVVGSIGLFVSTWFYLKLGISSIAIPLLGSLELGWFIIPIFTIIMMLIYSGGIIDGVDGLAGGVFTSMFAAYGVIAFSLGQINIAAFCAAIVGGLLAFLWFNIPPARFYMSETGSMALTITLTLIAFMTDTIGGGYGLFVLPIIAILLILTTLSVIIQLTYKKFNNGKKIFNSTPIHHHFESLGWSSAKVAMRYWIISVIAASAGIIIALIV